MIGIFLGRIEQSALMVKELAEERLTSSMDFSAVMVEEEVLEHYLKSLTIFVKIYAKMVKNRRTEEEAFR